MRLILKAFYLTSTLLTLLVIFIPFLVLSNAPTVVYESSLDHESLIQLKKTLYTNNPFKPHRIKKQQTVSLSEKTVNQAIQVGLEQQKIPLPTRVNIHKDILFTESSFQLGQSDFYINIHAQLSVYNNLVRIDELSIGQLVIPKFFLHQLYPYALKFLINKFPVAVDFINAIKTLEFREKLVKITYVWNYQITDKLREIGRDLIISPEESERVQIYYKKITEVSRLRFFFYSKLSTILHPVFALAKQRSKQTHDPVSENKAALIALGLAISGVRPSYIFKDKQRIAYLRKTILKNRRDLAQHFLISSTLSVISNKTLSDAIGLSKEIDDSRGGSGFSFPDLLADKAGIQFAELLTSNKKSALYAQEVLANPKLSENDFMPGFQNLPEAITELQFKKKYIDITHPKYLFVEREINRRISECKLYKNSP